jgi:hypothetical protein
MEKLIKTHKKELTVVTFEKYTNTIDNKEI